MKELSVFVDESGDFGPFSGRSPYYIFAMVFHTQSHSISEQISKLEDNLNNFGIGKNHCIHTAPLIRREEGYAEYNIEERRKILNYLVRFVKNTDVAYKMFSVDKEKYEEKAELVNALDTKVKIFLIDYITYFEEYDKITIYYDNGQSELAGILKNRFLELPVQIDLRNVSPSNYRLFQAADLFCTMELIKKKCDDGIASRTEKIFFGNSRDMKKNYLKPLSMHEFKSKVTT